MNKTSILLLLVALITFFGLTAVSPVKTPVLPSPFIIAVIIVTFVAIFGAIFSLFLRKRGKKPAG